MNRFHLNWNTGSPQGCAREDCPEDHASFDECRMAYERKRAKFTIPPPWTKTNRPPR